jgi:tetratricopeptide (TPR) repeat protein
MRTKLSVAAAAVAESCWLAALVVVPVFFNVHSFRTFEEDKIPLFRSLAALLLVALIVRTLEGGRRAWTVAGRPFWRLPLVRVTLALAATYVVSTVFSIAPWISLWGSYERTQGTYTWLSYVVVFVGIVLVVQTRQQIERVVTVIILASIAPAIYAVVQHFGYDPIRWGLNVTERAHGTAGNPIFLAAYLIMVVPLVLGRGLARWVAGGPRARGAALAHLSVLILQCLALLYSESRGPLIGLAVGTAVLCLVTALHRQRRRLAIGFIGLALAAALFIGVLNLKGGPLPPLNNVPYFTLLGRLFESGSGTAKVRVLIWQGAVKLLAARPLRDVVGYGPETLFLAYPPFYPPELARFENLRVAPDRAHNETFDALITTGIVGCVAELGLFVASMFYLLQWLGLITERSQRRLFTSLVITGSVVGAFAPYIVEGRVRYAGLGLPFGIVAALLLYLFITAIRTPARPLPTARWGNGLLLALFGAILAHFVELQFGIAVGSTRLLFAVYTALAVAVGVTARDAEDGSPATFRVMPASSGFDYGITVGLVLILQTFAFYRPEFDFRANAAPLLAMFLGEWVLGAVLAATASADNARTQLGRYSAASLGVWLSFATVFAAWFNWRPSLDPYGIAKVLPASWHLVNCLLILYLFVFATVGIQAAALVWRQPLPPATPWFGRAWRVPCALLLLLTGVPVITRTNLQVSQADMFLKQIDSYTAHKRFDGALAVGEEARRLDAGPDQYATAIVRVLMDLARAEPQQRATYLPRAHATMAQAQGRNPLNLDNTRNLARLHRLWAGLATDQAERQQQVDLAQGYYAHATQLSPNNASIWNEWALLSVELRETDKALALLNRSLEIDDGYTTTWWLRANLHLDTGSPQQALAEYDRALQINPRLLAAWSGKGLALARLDRVEEAIAANKEALKVAPQDLISHRNLALLYYQTGRPELAIEEATAALGAASSEKDKADLETFIQQVRKAAGSG